MFKKTGNYTKHFYAQIYNRLPHFLRKQTPVPLGRWNTIGIDNNKRLNISVKANYDHCGPCGNEYKSQCNIKKNDKHN